MNHKIRIIKRGDGKKPELDRLAEPGRNTTREITSTIKLWVREFKGRRRTDEQNTRNTYKQIITTVSQT
jgi:hypothetical protein